MKNIAFVLFVFGSLAGCTNPSTTSPSSAATLTPKPLSTASTPSDNYQAVANAYLARKESGGWWIDEPTAQPSSVQVQKMVEIGQAVLNLIESQPTHLQEIADYFEQIYLGYEMNGKLLTTSSDTIVRDPKSVGIVFYSRQDMARHPASLWYDREKKAILVAAFDWDPNFIGAAIIHELGHALYDRQGRPSSTSANTTDEWIKEELDMHVLEMKLLDAKSGGKYFKAADQVLAGLGGLDDPVEILSVVDEGHLEALDAAITETVSQEEAGLYVTQHALTLAARSTNGSTTEMVRFYRALTNK